MALIRHFPIELACWIIALALLGLSDQQAAHFSLCPLANLGIHWCPGCGLGHSISAFLHGNIRLSIQYHWFGIPATAILLHRIWYLAVKTLKFTNLYHKPNHES